MTAAADPAQRLARELWHESDVSTVPRPGAVEHRLMVRGGAVNVLPVRPRHVAASSMLRWTDDASPATAAMRLGVWAGIRVGAAYPLLRQRVWVDTGPGTLHAYLAGVLDVPHVHLTAAFGPPRPNQKPVLRIFNGDGVTLAFAKIGWNPLTTELVSHEAAFLRRVLRPPGGRVQLPQLLHLDQWGDRHVALLSVLLGDFAWQRAPGPGLPVLQDIARLGDTYTCSLGESPYLRRVGTDADGDLSGGLDEIARRWSGVELPHGRWHGDWTPWNMRTNRDATVVWDWERTAADTPVGFDALHYEFHRRMAGGETAALPALLAATEAASTSLDGLGVPATGIPPLLSLYAAEMYARFGPAVAAGTPVGWAGSLLPEVLGHFSVA